MVIDWIILILGVLAIVGLVHVLHPGRNLMVWLSVMTTLFFVFPRAGIVVKSMNLPLPAAHIIACLAILYWLIFHKRQHRGSHQFYGKFFLVYTAIACVGLVIGLSSGGGFQLALLETFFYLFTIGIFFYVNESFDQKHHFDSFMYLFLLASAVVSVYGIAQIYWGDHILVRGLTYNSNTDLALSYLQVDTAAGRRVLSSYGDPNVLAGQMIVFGSIALALSVWKGVDFKTRLIGFTLLILNTICIIATGSRAGWICLILSGIILLSIRNRWLLLAIPVLLLALVMTGQGVMDTLLVSVNPKFARVAGDPRFQYPAIVMQLMQIIPFGSGFGRMVTVYPNGAEWAFRIQSANTVWAGYNSYWMNILCRLGPLGLLSFIVLLLSLFWYIFKNVRTIDNPRVKAILLGGTIGLMGQFIIWLANNTYFLPGGGLNYWFILGMLVAGSRAWARPVAPALWIPWWQGGWTPPLETPPVKPATA